MRHSTSQRVCNDESYKHCSVHSFNMSPYFIVINVDWHHYTSLPWYWYLIAYQSRDNTATCEEQGTGTVVSNMQAAQRVHTSFSMTTHLRRNFTAVFSLLSFCLLQTTPMNKCLPTKSCSTRHTPSWIRGQWPTDVKVIGPDPGKPMAEHHLWKSPHACTNHNMPCKLSGYIRSNIYANMYLRERDKFLTSTVAICQPLTRGVDGSPRREKSQLSPGGYCCG